MRYPAKRIAVLLVASLATGCAAVGPSDSTPSEDSSTVPRSTSAPPSSEPPSTSPPNGANEESRLNVALADAGLKIDRRVRLPGSSKAAYVLAVPGESAIEAWHDARALVPKTKRYPVIVGGPIDYGGEVKTEFEQTLEAARYSARKLSITVDRELAAASRIDVGQWFTKRTRHLEIRPKELEAQTPLPRYEYAKDQFGSNLDVVSGEPLDEVEIALLPTTDGAEAPAYLLWGGWNDTPLPREIVAVFRHWAQTHDAEVVAMTGDVVEMRVGTPPSDAEDAIDLAREHFIFAPDNVWQGTGDLETLAAAVQDAEVWYFWWD